MATKYYDGVFDAQRAQKPVDEMPPFDAERLRSKGAGKIVGRILENPRWIFRLLRRWKPTLTLFGVTVVSRHDDVREVLERQDVFETPFAPEMKEMAGGTNFILGMSDSKEYRKMKSAVLSAFPIDEVEGRVRPIAMRHSRDIMLRAGSSFDVVGNLLKIVPVRICRDYYGLLIDDEEAFADRAIALSSIFFADPGGSPATRELAVVAARDMLEVIDRSVAAVRNGKVSADTPLGRLVALVDKKSDPLPMDHLHSIMMGMVSGFTPTNVLAAGNCLDVVLSKRDAQDAVEEAIRSGDDKLLDRAIVEAMRFKPINAGPFRYANQDHVLAKGTKREYRIKKGSTVVPMTWSAMFDADAVPDPENFDPARPDSAYMVFGHGIHWCIGAALAKIQIAEAFRAVFSKKNVRRASGKAGRLKRRGAFPENLEIEFELPEHNKIVDHAMVTMCFPVKESADLVALEKQVAELGNPCRGALCEVLDESGSIHFSSMAIIGSGERPGPSHQHPAHLVLEFSADHGSDQATDTFADATEAHLRPIFASACGLDSTTGFRSFLKDHLISISPFFWDEAGIPFSGTPGHSVNRIKQEADLQIAIADLLNDPASDKPRHAAGILSGVRAKLAEQEYFHWAFQPTDSLLEKPAGSWWKAGARILLFTAAGVILLALWLGASILTYIFVLEGAETWIGRVFTALASGGMALIGLVIAALICIGLLILLLMRRERSDPFSTELVSMDRYSAILERENHGQLNHLTGVSVLKAGLFRRFALRLVFYIIGVAAKHVFSPGKLSDIDTIHFARWAVVPGTNKLCFFSNYGGSWESYLEDFITKARQGLTGVWSNTIGFPPAMNLFWSGAKNGDLFKRWARMQQAPTLFWYSAYPGINTRRIRINSAIRQGLARAESEDQAREWLNLFGSLPRPDHVLETGDIQSIVFGAMGHLRYADLLALSIPDNISRHDRKAWLEWLESNVTFGDRKPEGKAIIAALGPDGIARLGLGEPACREALNRFPTSYRQGMDHEARSRILGDDGGNAPGNWRWGNRGKPADAVIICYAADSAACSRLAKNAAARSEKAGITVHTRVRLDLELDKNKLAHEHFGFVDGVSQPLVAGTSKALNATSDQHVVEPGEFLLGYRDQRGYFPLSPAVADFADRQSLLAALPTQDNRSGAERYHPDMRDFGRNGTFLVVRQLEQHIKAFEDFCAEQAKKINRSQTLGVQVSDEWVAAKMVGRWKDGTSLVRNPYGSNTGLPDNEFTFGREDPQGMRCPLGAHIRRSNPRDSLGEDRERQTELTKRHRIMRMGRPYTIKGNKQIAAEKGLMFMCLNADIERQFEFIQQTWISASAFHGLQTERDPLIGDPQKNDRFSIPTENGAVTLCGLRSFTKLHGGGYFFVPGRSALKFLISQF